MNQKHTIKNFLKEFPDDDRCLEYIFRIKYGYKPCPKCKKGSFYRVRNRKCYACSQCAYQIHPLANTIFHKSSTKLTSWFYAIFLISQAKNGISAKELQRHLGLTYKTTWRMGKQIRSLMKQEDKPLKGVVEIDEAYFGGVWKNHKGRYPRSKVPVFGLVERGGRVKTKVVEDTTRYTLLPLIKKYVAPKSEIMSDDYSVYKKVIAKYGYKHKVINHTAGKYVNGRIYTNTIESVWSQAKRTIRGTHHSVSPQHLQSYLDQLAFHHNHRGKPVFPLLLDRTALAPV
jgi:transposase